MMKKIILSLTCLLLVNACTTLPGIFLLRKHANLTDYNPQNYQGCTVAEYIVADNADFASMQVRWWDCKDKATVSGGVDLNADGVPDFTYSASDVVGSDAAQIRADVEKAFAEAGVEIIPGVVDGIINALKPGP